MKVDKKTRRRIRRALREREEKAAAGKKRGLRALAVSGMLGLLGVTVNAAGKRWT